MQVNDNNLVFFNLSTIMPGHGECDLCAETKIVIPIDGYLRCEVCIADSTCYHCQDTHEYPSDVLRTCKDCRHVFCYHECCIWLEGDENDDNKSTWHCFECAREDEELEINL